MKKWMGAVAFAGVLTLAGGAQAATITFDGGTQVGGTYVEDGLTFDDVRIVNGNCDSASGAPCGAINDNEVHTLTAVDGGTFTITSLWFHLLGNGTTNALILTTNLGGSASFSEEDHDNNDGGQTISLASLLGFQGITWLQFSTVNGGNVRIDDLNIAPVPLPAGGLLLLTGLAGLAALRRRKQSL